MHLRFHLPFLLIKTFFFTQVMLRVQFDKLSSSDLYAELKLRGSEVVSLRILAEMQRGEDCVCPTSFWQILPILLPLAYPLAYPVRLVDPFLFRWTRIVITIGYVVGRFLGNDALLDISSLHPSQYVSC